MKNTLSDTELGDAVVALGVGKYFGLASGEGDLRIYGIGNQPIGNTGMFVRSWLVAGALMEKAQEARGYDAWQPNPDHYDMPLPRAIIEACVEALS